MKSEPWEGLICRDIDIGITFVITQEDIEARAVFLNEIILKDQGFSFGMSHRDFDTGDMLNQRAGFA